MTMPCQVQHFPVPDDIPETIAEELLFKHRYDFDGLVEECKRLTYTHDEGEYTFVDDSEIHVDFDAEFGWNASQF